MKKILMISYYFTKNEFIGAIRLQGLAKYLPEFGWEPIILTSTNKKNSQDKYPVFKAYDPGLFTWIKRKIGVKKNQSMADFLNIQKHSNGIGPKKIIINLGRELFAYPDVTKNWYPFALETANEILKNYDIEAIISSSSPVTTHLIASTLKRKYNIIWLADLRDLWTQNHYYKYSVFRKSIEKKMEKKSLKSADAIITISEPLVYELKKIHVDKPVFSILNGFDLEKLNFNPPDFNYFSICYTGNLYQGRRDPGQLLAAISKLCKEGKINKKVLRIDFFGNYGNWLTREIEKFNLQDVFTLHGNVMREIAIENQCKAQLLLLLTWNDPAEKGVYTGKLFDYLAARRPILSLGYTDGGVVKELLDQTQAGVHCSNEAELREYLLKAYREYKELGAVQYRGIEAEVMKYSHREMARKFAEVLEEVAGGN